MADDPNAPVEFLHTAFEPTDWVAVFMKTFTTGETAQRVVPVSVAAGMRFQSWLRHRNANGWNVYVSVNAVRPGRSRTRRAIAAVRHVFLEEDRDGPALLATLESRGDLPPVSYVLNSSPGRMHVFWRATNFDSDYVERLQKHLAKELGTDAAATSCAQTTRLPGFMNHKRELPHRVTVEYPDRSTAYAPAAFPSVGVDRPRVSRSLRGTSPVSPIPAAEQARRFLAAVPIAVAGQHGDAHTFRICCRLVRGFALSYGEALELLGDWNRRCEPPWPEQELLAKLQNARRYGHEPFGTSLHITAEKRRHTTARSDDSPYRTISIDKTCVWLYTGDISSPRTGPQGRASNPCSPASSGPARTQPLQSVSGPRQSWRTRMSKSNGELVSVKIIPNEQGNPPGKLADAEVVFEAEAGPLSGMKLIGFSVWERRDGGRNVTFPARQYSVNGERRSFALLRPANGELGAQDAIKQCILDAYSRGEAHS